MEKVKKYNDFVNEEASDTIVLWADGIVGDFDKAVKKAKVKGKGGKGWDKEYRTNAEAGHGTVFFITAKNKEEAMGKLKKAKKSGTNIYVLNEKLGSFSNREHDIIGKDVKIVIHKTNNDGRDDLFGQIGKITDINENGGYIVRMGNGELYTFTREQIGIEKTESNIKVGMIKEDKEWDDYLQKKKLMEKDFDELIQKYFGKISGNDMKHIFDKSHHKRYGG